MTSKAISDRFYKTRTSLGISTEEFQFRDLRAKAGTDTTDKTGDIRKAQKQLGHTSMTMTEEYVRNRKGARVDPTK